MEHGTKNRCAYYKGNAVSQLLKELWSLGLGILFKSPCINKAYGRIMHHFSGALFLYIQCKDILFACIRQLILWYDAIYLNQQLVDQI
jgi:hypothetical protein